MGWMKTAATVALISAGGSVVILKWWGLLNEWSRRKEAGSAQDKGGAQDVGGAQGEGLCWTFNEDIPPSPEKWAIVSSEDELGLSYNIVKIDASCFFQIVSRNGVIVGDKCFKSFEEIVPRPPRPPMSTTTLPGARAKGAGSSN